MFGWSSMSLAVGCYIHVSEIQQGLLINGPVPTHVIWPPA